MASGIITFDWMRGHSESSSRGWESRWEKAWERGEEGSLGPKGQAYLSEKYGQSFEGEEPSDGWDEFDDVYDVETEY